MAPRSPTIRERTTSIAARPAFPVRHSSWCAFVQACQQLACVTCIHGNTSDARLYTSGFLAPPDGRPSSRESAALIPMLASSCSWQQAQCGCLTCSSSSVVAADRTSQADAEPILEWAACLATDRICESYSSSSPTAVSSADTGSGT